MIATSRKAKKYVPYVFTTNDKGEVTNSAWGDVNVATSIADVCYRKNVSCWLWPESHCGTNPSPAPVGFVDNMGNIAWLEN